MHYFSTKNSNERVPFKDAVLNGIAPDGGLYMPAEIPRLDDSFFDSITQYSLPEIGFEVMKHFADDIPEAALREIIDRAVNFEAPLHSLENNISVLELFHGPTLAFKDFGARFLARSMAHFNKDENKELVILVATSGDTGSAVGRSFLGIEGVKVGLLYPSGKVSKIQEQQLTTMGGNISAFEVDGTFDDCQRLVKQIFMDREINNKYTISSANSINIARLLPQSFYYFSSYAALNKMHPGSAPVYAVPSGNFGNLSAGLIAARMGLPVSHFIAAVNANNIFPDYLNSGEYKPQPAVKTISNAMDVGDPSNFTRIRSLFNDSRKDIAEAISSYSINDEQTLQSMNEVYQKNGYVIDPHGAVGIKAIEMYRRATQSDNPVILFETAHPAKFADVVEPALGLKVETPQRLARCLDMKKKALQSPAKYESFKEILLNQL